MFNIVNVNQSQRFEFLNLASVPLTLAHIDELKIFSDKSTLFSKVEVRIITDTPRNVNVYCRWDVPGKSHVDLPSTFGVEANMILSRLVRRANHEDIACDTYK